MQTEAELEAEIKAKKEEQRKQFESPFVTVGNAVTKRGPGRPPKEELNYTDAEAANEQRMQRIKQLPDDATEEQHRDQFQKELYKMLPTVSANLSWDVNFGNSKERSEAGTKVLRALGLENKDIGNIGKGGQIVINMNGPANTLDLPLLRVAKPVMQTLEAEATEQSKKEESK